MSSITRSYYDGHADLTDCDNMEALMGAGVMYRDGLYIPDFEASSPLSQIGETAFNLRTNCQGAWSGTLWIDVTVQDFSWSDDSQDNQYYL